MSQQQVSVLVLVYDEMDLLDIVGPLEAFSRALDKSGKSLFKPVIAGPSKAEQVQTAKWIKLTPDITYEEAMSSLGDYDVLLIPGGPMDTAVSPHLKDGDPLIEITTSFSKLGLREGAPVHRVLMSVCTGAFIAAYAGIFTCKECTTHAGTETAFVNFLKEHDPGSTYIKTSYVDGGKLSNGIRVLSTGGITNGMDGSLYLVGGLFGQAVKEVAIGIMQYNGLERRGIVKF